MYVKIGSLDMSGKIISRLSILGMSDLVQCYLYKIVIQNEDSYHKYSWVKLVDYSFRI